MSDWIQDKGTWGEGLLTKPRMSRKEMIRRARRKYRQELLQHGGDKSSAYRATISSLNVLLLPKGNKVKYGKRVNALKSVVEDLYKESSTGEAKMAKKKTKRKTSKKKAIKRKVSKKKVTKRKVSKKKTSKRKVAKKKTSKRKTAKRKTKKVAKRKTTKRKATKRKSSKRKTSKKKSSKRGISFDTAMKQLNGKATKKPSKSLQNALKGL